MPPAAPVCLRLALEGTELADPSLRQYKQLGAFIHLLKPVNIDIWLMPARIHLGSIPGDWQDIGFLEPPVGRVSLGLLTTGETVPLLHVVETNLVYVSLPDYGCRVFRAAATTNLVPPPPWPWRTVPWSDTQALLQLVGKTIALWPLRTDGYWDALLEPLYVSAVYAPSTQALGRGIGVVPALQGPSWPLRRMVDLEADTRSRKLEMSDILRPSLVLWAPAQSAVPLIFGPVDMTGLHVWHLDEAANKGVLGFRLVLPDVHGTDPAVWDLRHNPLSPGWAATDMDVKVTESLTFCVDCAKTGLHRVPVVNKTLGTCLRHTALRRSSEATFGKQELSYSGLIKPREARPRQWKNAKIPVLGFSQEYVIDERDAQGVERTSLDEDDD